MRIVGTAMFSWLTDQVGAAAAGQGTSTVSLSSYGSLKSVAAIESVLAPQYLQDIPNLAGWKLPFQNYLQTENVHERQVMLIRSRARDNAFDSSTYSVTSLIPRTTTRTSSGRTASWCAGLKRAQRCCAAATPPRSRRFCWARRGC